MVIDSSCDPEVMWVGQHDPNIEVPQLATKTVYYYKKCIFAHMTLRIGDYVLIANVDAPDAKSRKDCHIGKILYLYELKTTDPDKDIYRTIVQWYSRLRNVPQRCFDKEDINIVNDIELIEDLRPFDNDIPIETIFNKCIVINGQVEESPLSLLNREKSSLPMFVCRYKLLKYKGKYKLFPLSCYPEDFNAENTNSKRRSCRKTPKKTENAAQAATPKTSKRSSRRSSVSSSSDIQIVSVCRSNTKKQTSRNNIPEIEFIDVNKLDKCKDYAVSPIKIVKNVVVKLKNQKFDELNANYLTESPKEGTVYQFSPNLKKSSVRRNLNISLNNDTNISNNSDILNYSIVNTPQIVNGDDIKIKLRLSENQNKLSKLSLNEENVGTPRRSNRLSTNETPSHSLGRSTRKRTVDEDYKHQTNCTPVKQKLDYFDDNETPRNRILERSTRKSILKTPTGRQSIAGTPKRNIQLSNIVEEVVYNKNSIISTPTKRDAADKDWKPEMVENLVESDEDWEPETPKRRKSITTPKNRGMTPKTPSNSLTPAQKLKLIRTGEITPSIQSRDKTIKSRKSDLDIARQRLHVSAIPESLPCREEEFNNIYTFLEGKIEDNCCGCMYISGVPGTGKTATVTEVIRTLQRNSTANVIPEFDYIEINGMRLTEPRQAYVQIYKQLTGKTVQWEHAYNLLDKRFSIPSPHRRTTVLLVDELDILCNRRQDVVYNLLDWPSKSAAQLIVVTIANTMDLPERLLKGKVTSRLGLTRLTFQPYSYKQLQEIVMTRLAGSKSFKCDAVQLVARKVAAVSGDARRALDICRRATEIAEMNNRKEQHQTVTMANVQQALAEMIATAKVQAIKNCSKMEQVFLQAVVAEVTRTGVEETSFLGVYTQLESITAFMGILTPTPGRALKLCSKLGADRLLICEHSRTDIYQKILLNVSADDIHYALQVNLD